MKQILHAVNNNILKNISILQENFVMAEDIYVPSVPCLQGKTVRHKVQHVEPIAVQNVPKGILYRYNNVNLFCDIMHINDIGFLNTIFWHILFAMVSMLKI